MAAVNTKSTLITNADADPRVLSAPHLGGQVRGFAATVEVAAADDNASVFRMFRVHSSWRVQQLLLFNDAITSGTQYDVGLYQTAANGGAVVDADCWANNVTMVSARGATGPLDLTFATLNIDKIEKTVWEVAAVAVTTLLADPNRWYDICLTADAAGSGAGTISMNMLVVCP
jgi:hypothetical protein